LKENEIELQDGNLMIFRPLENSEELKIEFNILEAGLYPCAIIVSTLADSGARRCS